MFPVLFTFKIRPTKGNGLNPVSKTFLYSLHWQASELLNCIPLKSNLFSETTIVFSFLLKSTSHRELVIKAESSWENSKYWKSRNKIKAHKIQLLLAFTQPAGTHWCKWPEAFARTSINTWSLISETLVFGYIMAQYHKAIPVSLELTARGRILKFKKLSIYS